ncbi:MAG: hypothetical protein Q4A78_12160 [Peptostreptococcaceae bacterium]|nr:hypothetical protein [Peptostreptococcaceae bacterium]
MTRDEEEIVKRAVELYFSEDIPVREAVDRAEEEYRREHEGISGSDGRPSDRTSDAGAV